MSNIIILSLRNRVKGVYSALRSNILRYAFKECHSTVRFGRIGRIEGSDIITIGRSTCFKDDFFLTAWPEHGCKGIAIGQSCCFGNYLHLSSCNLIRIGDNLLTGKWVTITDNSHGLTSLEELAKAPSRREMVSKGPVIIGNNVWIGDKVTILPGVTIGDGCVIAANSVVTRSFPPFSVVGGIPAKLLKVNKINENNKKYES